MNRTVIYCRIDGPVSEISQDLLDLQREQLFTYARRKNIEISGVYEDVGYAGDTLDRPGLQGLMRDIYNGEISMILVVDHCRLFRRQIPQIFQRLRPRIQSIGDHGLDISGIAT